MTSLAPLSALLFGAAIMFAGNGLQGILLPVRAGLEGFATGAIGLLAAAYSAGFVIGCAGMPHVVQRVGHIRAFAALAAIAASVVLIQSLVVTPTLWIPVRVLSGMCFSGLFMITESWLNERVANADRGRVFAVYMVVNLGAVTLGQMILPLGDPATFDLFAITAIAITLALVPIALTTSTAPRPIGAVRLRLLRLYRMSPVAVVGCFFVGLANGAFGGLGAVFAQRIGLSVTGIALFMSASFIGGALAQVPLGRLSDRVDRRAPIALACGLSVLAGTALAFVGDSHSAPPRMAAGADLATLSPTLIILLVGLFGAVAYPLYALCISHANDFAGPEDFVETSSGLLLTWGIGASIGPVAAAALMASVGLAGLFLFTATVHFVFGFFALYRISRRAALPAGVRPTHVFTPGAARVSTEVAAFDPRAPADPELADGTVERTAAD